MLIKIYEFRSMMPRGDRDPGTHPCSKFEVWLINGEKKECIQEFDQWDPFWSSIRGNRLEYLRLATEKAQSLSELLGGVKIESVETTANEVEIMRLEKIRDDAEEQLRKLRS